MGYIEQSRCTTTSEMLALYGLVSDWEYMTMEIDHMSPQLFVRTVQGRAYRPHSIHSTTGASRHIKKTALFSPVSAALQERTFISEFYYYTTNG
jgi:hypothetical protein